MHEGAQTFFRITVMEERDVIVILWFILIKQGRHFFVHKQRECLNSEVEYDSKQNKEEI